MDSRSLRLSSYWLTLCCARCTQHGQPDVVISSAALVCPWCAGKWSPTSHTPSFKWWHEDYPWICNLLDSSSKTGLDSHSLDVLHLSDLLGLAPCSRIIHLFLVWSTRTLDCYRTFKSPTLVTFTSVMGFFYTAMSAAKSVLLVQVHGSVFFIQESLLLWITKTFIENATKKKIVASDKSSWVD